MTPADPTPRKTSNPPEASARPPKGRAAVKRASARQARPQAKAAKGGRALARRGPSKAALPAKVRVLKAGPRRVKAPAPQVWEVKPEPVVPAPIELGASASGTSAMAAPILATRPKRTMGKILLVGAVVLALAVVGLATQVTSAPNTGALKVHDGATADPDQRNEPHVSGDLYVEGFNMDADSGDLFFFSWPPTGNGELVLETTWEADDAEPAFHFLAGPFELPCGHYRVGASNGEAEPDDFPGGMKKKTFWVDCEEGPEPEPEPTTSSSTGPSTGPEPEPEPEPEPTPELACPSGLLAVANNDGTVQLTWTEAPGSDGTNVYRAEGDGDFEYVTTTAAGVEGYLDTTTVVGQSYTYLVTGLFGNEESQGCEVVETTAIPEFPTALGLSLATVGGVVALALAGRRKA